MCVCVQGWLGGGGGTPGALGEDDTEDIVTDGDLWDGRSKRVPEDQLPRAVVPEQEL